VSADNAKSSKSTNFSSETKPTCGEGNDALFRQVISNEEFNIVVEL